MLVTLSGQCGVSGNSGLSLWVGPGHPGPLGSLGPLGTRLFHREDAGQLLEVRLAKAVASEACGVPLCAELRSVGPLGFLSQQESGLWGFFCELAWGVRVLLSLWGCSLSQAGMFCVWGLSLGVSGISGTSSSSELGLGSQDL